ncbi:MAG: hypothetical protein ABMA14_28960 [Hyphomonadaceae bacterium]
MKQLFLAPVTLALAACNPAPVPAVESTPEVVAAPPLAMAAIAVLENQPGAFADQPPRFVVRMVFQNATGTWRSTNPNCADEACLASSAATWPPAASWTVVNAGAVVGRVDGTTPKAWTRYADVGTQDVASTADVPKVGLPTKGWNDADIDLQRPLVAVSIPKASDPDAWQETELTPAALIALQTAFTAQFATVQNCANDGGTDPKPMSYKSADIAVAFSHASTSGWAVATALLTDYRCDGPAEGTAFAPQTFAISPDGKAQYLGEGLKLLDSGDYDGNGKSEVLFAIQRGNTEGYELHFDNFAGHETFAYNHH